jgi:hypothetical protein
MFCGTCTFKYRHPDLMCEMEHFYPRNGMQAAAYVHEI